MALINSKDYAVGHYALTMSAARYLARLKELLADKDDITPQQLVAVNYLMGVYDMARLYLQAVLDKDSIKGSIATMDARIIEILESEGDDNAEG